MTRAAGGMAIGTAVSRLTGLIRTGATVAAVGGYSLGGAYNVANTTPNIVVDLVLGGVLSATFVPLFVDRLTTRTKDEAWEAMSCVVSVTLVVIGVAAIALLAISPLLSKLLLLHPAATQTAAQFESERSLTTALLYMFAPQMAAYGIIALATALLNARNRFQAPMFVPIVNNLVVIGSLIAFRAVVGSPSATRLHYDQGDLLLLGLGTTLGVVVQAALLVRSIRKTDLRLRWRLQWGHEAVRSIVRLSGWTFGLVLANQAALVVVLILSGWISLPGGGSGQATYVYAYSFFQLPYGIVAVSVMSAATPALARHWARGETRALARRAGQGVRAVLALVIPAAAALLVLAQPLASLLGKLANHGLPVHPLGQELAMLALGIPGFCTFIFAIRVLQSMQDMRTCFWLYVLENGLNIVLAAVLYRPLGVQGIGLSISVAYSLASVVALTAAAKRIGSMGGPGVTRPIIRVLIASMILMVATATGSTITANQSTPSLLMRVGFGAAMGITAYVLAMAVLRAVSRLGERNSTRPEPTGAGPDPSGPLRPGPLRPGPQRPGPQRPQSRFVPGASSASEPPRAG